jgi:hypothetical protein
LSNVEKVVINAAVLLLCDEAIAFSGDSRTSKQLCVTSNTLNLISVLSIEIIVSTEASIGAAWPQKQSNKQVTKLW